MNIYNETMVIRIVDILSSDLAMRNSAIKLFFHINSLPVRKIILDFDSVTSISRSFSDEYLHQKKVSDKEIEEINTPIFVEKMFFVITHSKEKTKLIDIENSDISIFA